MELKEIKLLWGKAGGRCSFQDCREELSQDDVVLGEQAHIIAKREDGPRGEGALKLTNRDKYNNLILLCSHHHTLIDKAPGKYSVEALKKIKLNHEQWVSDRLNTGTPWAAKLAQVHYLNIPRLSILFVIKGYGLIPELDIEIKGDLHDLGGMPLIRIMHIFVQLINDLQPIALDLAAMKRVDEGLIGAIVSFDENFRTRNYSSYSGSLSGDINKDRTSIKN